MLCIKHLAIGRVYTLKLLLSQVTLSKVKAKEVREFNPAALSDYKKMFDNELFADFMVKCNDGEILKAHKVILAARSPVFYAMLNNNMKESNEGFVEIADFGSRTVKEVLRFIYCGKVQDLKMAARSLIHAAEKYELEELKEMCIDNIIEELSTINVLKCFQIANFISNGEKLSDECKEFTIRNYSAVKLDPDWKNLPNIIVLKICDEVMSRYINCNTQKLSTHYKDPIDNNEI